MDAIENSNEDFKENVCDLIKERHKNPRESDSRAEHWRKTAEKSINSANELVKDLKAADAKF